ncbi:MAG: transcriptional regulator [Chloroflexaceae bacterium]|nr:transcriptional regulator [Chloroflexaceae bacterium]
MTRPKLVNRFGEKLRGLRHVYGLTLEDLSEQLGIASGYLSMIETGQREPRISIALHVAQLFRVSTDMLLDDSRDLRIPLTVKAASALQERSYKLYNFPGDDIRVWVQQLKVQRFGQKMRALREFHGLSLAEVANVLGYAGSQQVSHIEVMRRKPSAEVILKIARLFNVSADMLLDDEQELALPVDTEDNADA